MVPYKGRDSKRVWEISSYTEQWQDSDGNIQTSDEKDYIFKKGVFYIKPAERKYSWIYKDVNGVDSKKEYIEDYGDDGQQHYHRILGGEPQMIVCSQMSVLDGVIPPFKSGYGCCNYSMGRNLVCECGNHVGHMYLDCYEDNTVHFIENKVTRTY
jgi:hypothetical protein